MKRIFLIGYMGSGKTTLGRALAKELNLSFVDLDWYIEERFHKTVRELFVDLGEDGFRELERKMLLEVSEFENVVISTGGGTPCFFDNMESMKKRGVSVFLNVSVETLFRRLQVAKMSRPLLMNKSDEELRTFIAEGIEKRLPFYSIADYTLDADELESRSQIKNTIKKLRQILQV